MESILKKVTSGGNMFYLIIALIAISISFIFMLLEYIDSRVNYKNRNIQYFFHVDNGLYIRVPYLCWQKNKKKFIEDLFSSEVNHEGKNYLITAILKNREHLQSEIDLLPPFFYRDYMATLELKRKNQVKIIKNTTKIIGNNNNVIIDQREVNNIAYEIDKLLNYEIDDIDRQCVELFKYKLKEKSVTDADKNRILAVLNKLSKYAPYASLTSSIIGLIKSLLP